MSPFAETAAEFKQSSDRLQSLFEGLQARYAEAEADFAARTAALEGELLAARNETETFKDAATARLERVRSLERQQLDWQRGGDLVVVLLDGDGAIPTNDRLMAGRAGGIAAASDIRSAVVQEASAFGVNVENLVVTYFFSRAGLAGVLKESAGIPCERFSEFMAGFGAASELFTWVDVGDRKEAADEKIKANMRLYGTFERCRRLYLGISHDSGYVSILESFKTQGLDKKIRLLKAYDTIPATLLQAMPGDPMVIPDLFRREKLPPRRPSGGTAAAIRSSSIPPTSPTKAVTYASAVEVIASPRTTSRRRDSSSPETDEYQPAYMSYFRNGVPRGAEKVTDWKSVREARPCNYFYLRRDGCSRDDCQYSHSIDMSQDMLKQLRKAAKTQACFDEKNGPGCGDPACFRGHVCPDGIRCTTNCNFGDTPAMHPPPSKDSDPALAKLYDERRARDAKDLETSGGMRPTNGLILGPSADGWRSRGTALRADSPEWRVVKK